MTKFLVHISEIFELSKKYVLKFDSKETSDKLVPILEKVYREFFGENAKQSPDLCRIINDRHYERLCALLDKTKGEYSSTLMINLSRIKNFIVKT